MDCVVAPLLHKYELALLEVSTTLPPAQNEVDPFAETVGVDPVVVIETIAGDDVAFTPLEFVTLTV